MRCRSVVVMSHLPAAHLNHMATLRTSRFMQLSTARLRVATLRDGSQLNQKVTPVTIASTSGLHCDGCFIKGLRY